MGKRDSGRAVTLRKTAEWKRWRDILREHRITPFTAATLHRRLPDLSQSSIYNRLKQLHNSTDSDTDDDKSPSTIISPTSTSPYYSVSELPLPGFIQRNQHKQALTPYEEIVLANEIRKIIQQGDKKIGKSIIKKFVLKFLDSTRHAHALRSKTFKVSNGWIQRFKWRHGFASLKTEVGKKTKESEKKDIEDMKVNYVLEIEDAVRRYGPDNVINMDETPVELCDVQGKGWAVKRTHELKMTTWLVIIIQSFLPTRRDSRRLIETH